MSQPINSLTAYTPATLSYYPRLRAVFETHHHYLRTHSSTQRLAVDQSIARPFFYNLYGFLQYQNYDTKLWWLILRLSGLKGPEDFDENTEYLLVPDLGLVDQILGMANG